MSESTSVPVSPKSDVSVKKKHFTPFLKGVVFGIVTMCAFGGLAVSLHAAEEQKVQQNLDSHPTSYFASMEMSGLTSSPNYRAIADNAVFKTEEWKDFALLQNTLYQEKLAKYDSTQQEFIDSLIFPDLKEKASSGLPGYYSTDENIGLDSADDEYNLFMDIKQICTDPDIVPAVDAQGKLALKGLDFDPGWFAPLHGGIKNPDREITSEEREIEKKAVTLVLKEADKSFCLSS